ncbi:facilitated trehalose transporter Tret1-like isoform X3 [Anopheles merus]|uniref:facilitated trehalose transporter Tret1-like isoform X3 n=1 Tax=Anopheles merus TaxID=30066 RepID=UPI001BE3EB03|nr:facilitated trehalose transporter Tret1-like isoform X3 [Anopheles merus]
MSRVGVLRQYMATVLVNLLGVSYGMISGWSSSALPTLQTSAGDERLLESGAITLQQASWIGGALCLGGIVGTLVGGAIVDRLGRKWTAWIAGLPLVVCWVLVIVANHPVYLMGARFLGGLAGGIEFVVTPLYVSEIACTSHRGTLSSLLILSCCLGVEFAYLAGALLHYYTIPWVSVSVPVFFLATFCFLPETPSHLAKVQKLAAAERSLRFFRGIRSEKDTIGEDDKPPCTVWFANLPDTDGAESVLRLLLHDELCPVGICRVRLSAESIAQPVGHCGRVDSTHRVLRLHAASGPYRSKDPATHLVHWVDTRTECLCVVLLRSGAWVRSNIVQLAAFGLLLRNRFHWHSRRRNDAVRCAGGNHATKDQRIRNHLMHGDELDVCIYCAEVLFHTQYCFWHVWVVAILCNLFPPGHVVCVVGNAGN